MLDDQVRLDRFLFPWLHNLMRGNYSNPVLWMQKHYLNDKMYSLHLYAHLPINIRFGLQCEQKEKYPNWKLQHGTIDNPYQYFHQHEADLENQYVPANDILGNPDLKNLNDQILMMTK